MSRLAELQNELQEIAAAIARAERTVAAHPDVPSVLATLQTAQKRREYLEGEFLVVANELELDVCSYRIELDDGRPTLQGITGVLGSFQRLFTSVYAAIDKGPRQTTKVGAEITDATAFGFAYTFPGSVGVVMTLPNERLLVNKTKLDEAIEGVFEMMKARTPGDVKECSRKFGVASVRVVHQWAEENAKAGFGADIAWRRKDHVRDSFRIQRPEIVRLEMAIHETTDEQEETFVGELVMVDVVEKTFKMRVGPDLIEGTFKDAISATHSAELPRQYRAMVRVAKRILGADDNEEPVSRFLLSLDPT